MAIACDKGATYPLKWWFTWWNL